MIGPGTGSFLLIVLVAGLGYSFLSGSSTAKVVNLGTNLAALIVFGLTGSVLWALGLLMGAVQRARAPSSARAWRSLEAASSCGWSSSPWWACSSCGWAGTYWADGAADADAEGVDDAAADAAAEGLLAGEAATGAGASCPPGTPAGRLPR